MKILENYINQIKSNEDLECYFSSECDIDFVDQEILDDDLNFLMECGKCSYTLTPFACDGAGGIYAFLDNGKIGYLDSEGQAGIVANNMKDLFSIIVSCGYISDYAGFNCLKDRESFLKYFYGQEIPRDNDFVRKFIEENELEDDPNKLYEIFKSAVLSEPKLVIEATAEDYTDTEQLFDLLFSL